MFYSPLEGRLFVDRFVDKFRNVLSDPLRDYHVVAAKLLKVGCIVIRCLDNDYNWLPST
jgi:hypothetical protein